MAGALLWVKAPDVRKAAKVLGIKKRNAAPASSRGMSRSGVKNYSKRGRWSRNRASRPTRGSGLAWLSGWPKTSLRESLFWPGFPGLLGVDSGMAIIYTFWP